MIIGALVAINSEKSSLSGKALLLLSFYARRSEGK